MTAIKSLSEQQKRRHLQLNTDLPFFAKHGPLYIKDKDTGVVFAFQFNRAQNFLHYQLEEQRKHFGWVRALGIKGRQQGFSTYTGARFYHKTTRTKGKNAFVMAHDDETTELLFQTTTRFHENIHPALKPSTKHSNRRELVFDGLDSYYRIGTAGSKNTGRGGTIHLFHGSECAHWKNALDIKSGIMQSVPRAPGTEIILETTANGMDEMMYPMVMDAIDGRGDYMLVFIPWFWQDEYRAEPEEDFKLDDEEREYQLLYGLDLKQMAWRRLKVIELGSIRFKQEYPANVHEAFQTSGDSLIDANDIMRARKCEQKDPYAPVVLGCDPGRSGDTTEIVIRRGREILDWIVYDKMDQMVLAGILVNLIKANKVDMAFVDAGEGNGTVDRCHELGLRQIVKAIYFGSAATQKDIYLNKRAEMAVLASEWMTEQGVNIPDDDEFHKGLVMVPTYKVSSNGRKQLVSKDEIREKYKKSTNTFDALILTFAYPVQRSHLIPGQQIVRKTDTAVSRVSSRGRR